MKKTLTLMSVAALTGLTMMAAIQWGSVDNLAQGAAVTVSSKSDASTRITDGDDGTSWQAIPSTHSLTNDWAMIDLGEVKTFTDVEILWEAAHAKQYSVYVSETEIPYTTQEGNVNTEDNPLMLTYSKISEDWLAANTPAVVGTDDTEQNYTASHSFGNGISGRYILIYANELNNFGNQYGINIFEVKVANIQGRGNVAALNITPVSAKSGAEASVTVTAVNAIGETVSLDEVTDLKLTASSEAVTVKGGENGVFTVSGTIAGSYTLTATAKYGDVEVTGSALFVVEFDWTGVTNVAVGKTVRGRCIPGDDPNPAANAVDGDDATYYEANIGGASWLLVDLGSEYFVEAIGASYATANGYAKIGYSLDGEGILGHVGENSQWEWNTDGVPAGWNFTRVARATDGVATVTYATPVKARWIAVRDDDNVGGVKQQLREVLVKGTQLEASYAADIEITFEKGGLFVGETTNVGVSIVDQYGQPFGSADDAQIAVEGATYANGVITATATGKVAVTATVGETTKTSYIVVADKDDYCMTGATVTSDVAVSAASAATDGGKEPESHGNLYVVTENESQGDHTHWIMADLHKPYDLDMIIAIWEGACPADYDVYVGATEDSLEKLYSVTGHTQATWYDRFSGKEMNGVQFIKIVTTKNATVYGIKLFDLKAYGRSDVSSVPTEMTVTVDGDYIATDEYLNVKASVLDQFGGAIADAPIEFSCNPATASVENNMFKATEAGTYEVTATSGDISASATVHVVANESSKLGAIVPTVTINDETATQNPFVGNEIVVTELPSTMEIKLDGVYDFSLIKFRWEAACPSDYTVVATYANGNESTVLSVSGRGFVTGYNPIDRIVNADTPSDGSRAAIVESSSLNSVTKLTVTMTAKDHGYNLRLFGIDAYGVKTGDAAAISVVSAAEANQDVVYDLQGRNVSKVTRGLYIVNGRKVFVK